MDQARIEETIVVLEREIPRVGARVTLRQYGGGPDEGQVIANSAGYLGLGVVFLKAAIAPTEANDVVRVDIAYLMSEDSDIRFDWFERREVAQKSASEQRARRLAPTLARGALVAWVLLSLVGLITVLGWLGA